MATSQRQRGLTMISWVVIFALIGFIAMVIIKLVPVYIEHGGIKSAMKGVAEELGPTASLSAVRTSLTRRMGVDNITVVEPADFELIKDGETTYLELVYEARTPLFGNISLVVEFQESYEMGGVGG